MTVHHARTHTQTHTETCSSCASEPLRTKGRPLLSCFAPMVIAITKFWRLKPEVVQDNLCTLVRFAAEARGSTLLYIVQPPIQWLLGILSQGVKWPGCKVEHSLPSNTEVKNARSYYSTPSYASLVWCLIQHTVNLTFLMLHTKGYTLWCSFLTPTAIWISCYGHIITLPPRKSDFDQIPAETLKEIPEFPVDVLVGCWKSHESQWMNVQCSETFTYVIYAFTTTRKSDNTHVIIRRSYPLKLSKWSMTSHKNHNKNFDISRSQAVQNKNKLN
jgi:hypothetical protein